MVDANNAKRNAAAAAPDDSTNLSSAVPNNNSSNTNAPGGILGYFINRKIGASDNSMQPQNATDASSSQGTRKQRKASRSTTLRMHEMVNAGGSAYFGSVVLDADSDSDDENNILQQQSTTAAANISSLNSPPKSWLASYQNKQSLPLPSLKEDANPESASSWMNQALQTVDSAKEWISSSPNKSSNQQHIETSSNTNSNSWTTTVSSSVANAVSNTMATVSSFNPFADNDISQPHNDNPASSSTTLSSNNKNKKNDTTSSAFLPKFASNFDWATKQRNPYQAVVGRDADLLLSSPSNTWNNLLYSWTTWLPINWITTTTTNNTNMKQLMMEDKDGSNTGRSSSAAAEEYGRRNREMLQLAMGRKKSQPSEASVQAVKNLLLLVQQQVVEEEEGHTIDSEQQYGASTTIMSQQEVVRADFPLSSPNSPKLIPISSPKLPSLSTPNPLLMTPIPSLKEEEGEDGTTSFDSEPSYDPSLQSSPARASPTPADADHPFITTNNDESDTSHVFSPVSRRRAKRSTHIHGGGSDDHLNDNDDDCYNSKNNSNNNMPQPSPTSSSPTNHNQAMHAEMAARLAEGTLRAYRDLALDEATELHSALHHWTIRWERPL